MSLPNIEIVSLCVMLFAVTFGYRCVYPITVYVLLELTVFGFHYWSLNYLYIWFIPALAAFLLRESELENSTVLKLTHEIIGNHLGNPRRW